TVLNRPTTASSAAASGACLYVAIAARSFCSLAALSPSGRGSGRTSGLESAASMYRCRSPPVGAADAAGGGALGAVGDGVGEGAGAGGADAGADGAAGGATGSVTVPDTGSIGYASLIKSLVES